MSQELRQRDIVITLGNKAFRGLRVDYSVTKTLRKKPLNKASIEIYGLSKKTASELAETAAKTVDIPYRVEYESDFSLTNNIATLGAEPLPGTAFDRGEGPVADPTVQPGQERVRIGGGGTKVVTIPGTRIRILAGHSGQLHQIFEGNIIKDGLEVRMDGPARVVTIEAADGLARYAKSKLRKTFDEEVTAAQILEECSQTLGIPTGAITLPDETIRFSSGVAFDDSVEAVLDQIARATNADWSIVDGTLQFLGKDQTRKNTGPVYSSKNGNLLSIEPKDRGVVCTVIQDPKTVPGDRIVIRDSDDFDGTWKVKQIVHKGSLYADMLSEVTAERFVNGKAAPPPAPWEVAVDKVRDKILDTLDIDPTVYDDVYPEGPENADFN